MTVIELIKKLQSLPEDARVEVNIPLKINSAESFHTEAKLKHSKVHVDPNIVVPKPKTY